MDIFKDLPKPQFQRGDLVRTRVGATGDRIIRTEVTAKVRTLMWHGDRKQWLYYLEGNSRRRHRWYLAEDLEFIALSDESCADRP